MDFTKAERFPQTPSQASSVTLSNVPTAISTRPSSRLGYEIAPITQWKVVDVRNDLSGVKSYRIHSSEIMWHFADVIAFDAPKLANFCASFNWLGLGQATGQEPTQIVYRSRELIPGSVKILKIHDIQQRGNQWLVVLTVEISASAAELSVHADISQHVIEYLSDGLSGY